MEHCSMDPYEQQLLSVFDSYDVDRRGSLDRDGLVQLCNSLQLEEQGNELIKCLLSESKPFVTFNEFKEGLLTLLGRMQYNQQKEGGSDSEHESPDRELSPKFVYGSKKYGRRSRPEDNCTVSEGFENKPLKNVHKVQRSNSQSDVTHSKKRKTNTNLKRCTSFPGNGEKPFTNWPRTPDKSKIYPTNFEYNENVLRSALDHLNLGQDGYLTQFQIIQVCESIGLHKFTKQLSTKHDPDRRISVEELIDMIQKDDNVYENIPSPVDTLNSTLDNSCITEDSLLYPNNKSIQYIALGPDGSGVAQSQTIVELWENAGIQSSASLLQELGFNENQINVSELGSILEDELRTINDARANLSFVNVNPHVVLLQATIALYQSEVKYLKSALEQLNAERDKLRCDIADANFRVSLLAQEVDDNHAKMEKNTQKQVRLLEQKHSELLRDLTNQYTSDKESMTQLNIQLEKRLYTLENDETKLKSTLQAIEDYNITLEKENQILGARIAELEHVKISLSDRVTILESECRKMSDLERERDQLEPLLQKISVLQQENAELRDKNDELCTEVESLSSQVATMRVKLSSTPTINVSSSSGCLEENVSVICEGMGIKRRVDSPSKHIEYSLESESPRLGKVRKCYSKPELLEDALSPQLVLNASESGFEADIDYIDSSLSFTDSNDDVSILQSRIAYLEGLLLQNSIKLPDNFKKTDDCTVDKLVLAKRVKELESILEEVQTSVKKMLNDTQNCDKDCNLINPVSELIDKLQNAVIDSSDTSLSSTATTVIDKRPDMVECGVETDTSFVDMKNSLESVMKRNVELKEQSDNLQQVVELLRNEYDNCENYWATKLDEERQIYEQEQKISSEKLSELLIKISEYEEQFTKERLPPIEETECLEKQYMELDEEFQQFKQRTEVELEMKDKEIDQLQEKLHEFVVVKEDVETQVNILELNQSDFKTSTLSNVIESTNIFSSETLPHLWHRPSSSLSSYVHSDSVDSSLAPSNTSQTENPIWNDSTANSSNPNLKTNILNLSNEMSNTCTSLPATISWQPPNTTPTPQPHSITIIPDNNTNPSQNTYRVKRSRKHYDRNVFLNKKEHDTTCNQFGNGYQRNKWNNFDCNDRNQTCVVSISSIHHLHRRLHELDQHCRQLQFILKQQQQHSESLMQHCWKQYRDEISEMQLHVKTLQDKLSRSDMLIKDLYVENTHLIANNQRLEHRCHMLIQCNTESTSV